MFKNELLIYEALEEDIGRGDITTEATIAANARCRIRVLAKQDGVLSGIDVFKRVFEIIQTEIRDWESRSDGDRFAAGDVLATFTGNMQSVLKGERVALNFLQHLSGVASLTARFVEAAQGYNVRICGTRKTTPLLRTLENRAVMDGGGHRHRSGVYDGILIKENHIVGAGGIREAIERARKLASHVTKIQVEVENMDEFEEALAARADVIMLDNMSLEDTRVAVTRAKGAGILLEASGNITLEQVRAVAETGVDVISVGALTHSAPALDISLLVESLDREIATP